MTRCKLLLRLAAILVVAGGTVAPQSQSQSGERASAETPVVALHIGARSERGDGQRSGGTQVTFMLDSTDWHEAKLAIMPDNCTPQVIRPEGEAKPSNVEWHVAAQLVEFLDDVATVNLRWSRRTTGSGVHPAQPFEERRSLAIRASTREILDLWRVDKSAAAGCDRIVIDVGLELIERPEVANETFRLDMWLQQASTGSPRITSDQIHTNVKQGVILPFWFAPSAFALAGDAPADGPAALDVRVSGTVRCRKRSDGLIEAAVLVWREVRVRDGTSSVGRGGTKHVVVRPDETIALELPVPDGNINGVDLGPRFNGQTTAVLIRVRTQR
jgi:hypothetical protein